MKSFQKLFLGLLVAGTLIFTSCKKDDPVSCNWVLESQTELDILVNASVTYSNDPTTANCNAYKVAYQSWLNEVKDHRDCAVVAGSGADIDAAIAAAQADIDSLQC